MKINGTEVGGAVDIVYDDMRLTLRNVNTEGLSVGETVEIEADGAVYYGREIKVISGTTVECDKPVSQSEILEKAILELAQIVSDNEDALIELASIIG